MQRTAPVEQDLECCGDDRRYRRSEPDPQYGAGRVHRRIHRLRVPVRTAIFADSHKKTPKTSDYARRVRILHDYGIQVNGSFVFGFDHDRKDVFTHTAEWIEENRLECATFPYFDARIPRPALPPDGRGRPHLSIATGLCTTPATRYSVPST